MTIKPYIVVPNLILQPTWGGHYIAKHKQLKQKELKDKKIGQAYELYQFTNLSTKTSTKDSPSIEVGDSKQPELTTKFTKDDKIFSINQLIKINPKDVLGKKSINLFGNQLKTLIKYTQAKGNSYQLHVKKKTGQWLPKPESWYYFEPGLVTLGIKEGVSWEKYESTCLKINQLAETLSQQLKTKRTSLTLARKKLNQAVLRLNPSQFVNQVKIRPGQAINLSACGIHHSWEENKSLAPLGNIVYEVQENVYDPVSTIRSFDKGKIKDDGSIRQLQVKDYFKYIDRSLKANNPSTHIIKTNYIKKTKNYSVQQIFKSKKYSMQQINFNKLYQDQTKDTFHHLFVKKGQIKINSNNSSLTLTTGFSAFIPANTGDYQLTTNSKSGAFTEVLKTYI